MSSAELTLGNRVHISDPCYNRGTWCANWNVPCRPGKWRVFTEETTDGLEASARIEHEDFAKCKEAKCVERQLKDCGVDSGNCGFFADAVYPHGDTGILGDESSFYHECVNFGSRLVCKGRGYNWGGFGGDGSFPVTAWFAGEEMVACQIQFHGEEDEGDEDEDSESKVTRSGAKY